jgi:hypothetical protein
VSGLLIVNADDWGGSEATTDAILATFEAGRITSTSGMVHMPDSDRAAEIARGATSTSPSRSRTPPPRSGYGTANGGSPRSWRARAATAIPGRRG